ncbi:MAG: FGGY family carbohydrate kinase [Bacteroidota bacterium]|nr:FGGY family carbohydrate kinase [Bacteroidota bacterium]
MPTTGYLLGYDIGRSFIKASLLDAETGTMIASVSSPEKELEIITPDQGWAEQHPSVWWENVRHVTRLLRNHAGSKLDDVRAIGISYQMHGLVLIDNNFEVLRPAILGNDTRAVEIGERAFASLGEEACLKRLLNSPGNFTASKLKWVMENEYDIYKHIHKMMLPGDYIGMMMTGEILTTPSGLSEGIMWDFVDDKIADMVLKQFNIQANLIPNVVPNFFDHGVLTPKAASELGLKPGIKVTYRAGDHPNNALSLNVLQPGEAAAIAGTTGVVYCVTDKQVADSRSSVNTFLHINHSKDNPRYGVLLCVKSTGVLYSWLKKNIVTFGSDTLNYNQMNRLAELITAGSEGLVVMPYGNGTERTLENKPIGAAICNLDLRIHSKAHILRAGQEGIVFALKHGMETMLTLGMEIKEMRAINSNLFLSPVFCEAFATTINTEITLFDTDGSQGAARGAGVGAGIYNSVDEAFLRLNPVKVIEPNPKKRDTYLEAYLKWSNVLKRFLYAEENNLHN